MFDLKDILLKKENIVESKEINAEFNHIAFSADRNYIKHIGTAIFSILEHNPDLSLHFHLLVSDIEQNDLECFRKLADSRFNFTITVYHLNTRYFEYFPSHGYLSSAAYYRLAIPVILKKMVSRVLYIDADTLCLGPLVELFQLNLEDYVAAAVSDPYIDLGYIQQELKDAGFNPLNIYFNSGVLLINIDKWWEYNIYSQLESLISGQVKFQFMDQDILNIVLQGRILWLPSNYNWQYCWTEEFDRLYENKGKVKIAHFNRNIKPWHHLGFSNLYDYYKKRSPWHDIPYQHQDFSGLHICFPRPRSLLRRTAKRLWKQGDKKLAWQYYKQYLLRRIRGIA